MVLSKTAWADLGFASFMKWASDATSICFMPFGKDSNPGYVHTIEFIYSASLNDSQRLDATLLDWFKNILPLPFKSFTFARRNVEIFCPARGGKSENLLAD